MPETAAALERALPAALLRMGRAFSDDDEAD